MLTKSLTPLLVHAFAPTMLLCVISMLSLLDKSSIRTSLVLAETAQLESVFVETDELSLVSNAIATALAARTALSQLILAMMEMLAQSTMSATDFLMLLLLAEETSTACLQTSAIFEAATLPLDVSLSPDPMELHADLSTFATSNALLELAQ